jgi:hypothetical protein
MSKSRVRVRWFEKHKAKKKKFPIVCGALSLREEKKLNDTFFTKSVRMSAGEKSSGKR